ncbi:alpha/beta-hydrolase family protein [Mycobacterium sp. NPDC006124]|uniref:alpha/beta hydrolase n=1 Tax=Mycobacterium sp. NPDC006124 TaxID=3156729 RepID=UPI0033BC4799
MFLWLSLTPSLLPRGPLFQGLISGASGAVGYALGVFAVWLVRFMRSRDVSPRAPRPAWTVLGVAALLGTAVMMVRFRLWQNDVRDLMGIPRLAWWEYPLAVVVSILALAILVTLGKLVGRLVGVIVRRLERVAPPRVSAVIATGLVIALGVAVLNGVVIRVAKNTLNDSFAAFNDMVDDATAPPTSPRRSGGAGSLVSWESLGRQGRAFVQAGPSAQTLATFNGAPALEPIRVYAGLNSADDITATAELAAAELERTGGLRRKLVAVATTTGTGWINEAEADALEYILNGNSAIVSMQYSHLPSALSFLMDVGNARQAGRALFEAVDRRVQAMPPAQRPAVVVFGESLGSFGGEAPFLSLNNLLARTDGALFSGPTFANTMWDELTRSRDAGSPQWLPITDRGRHARFVARPEDLARPDTDWATPRLVYLQHPSDPITWWTPDLLFRQPDWLREPRGDDVSPQMQWIPVVTFLQVGADMAGSADVPDGHGHRFVRDVANAWAAILDPPGWTAAKTDRLRDVLATTN